MSLCDASVEQKTKYLAAIPLMEMLGDCILPGTATNSKKILSLAEMELADDDVIVASYQKSGTTWLSEVVSAIRYGGDIDTIKGINLRVRSPSLELEPLAMRGRAPETPEQWSEDAKEPSIAKMRILHTHILQEWLPRAAREGKTKVVYMARNPKDCAVSFFHYHQLAAFLGQQKDLTWADFLALFCSGHVAGGSWFKHVLSYWKFAQNNTNVLFVTYEDMQRDLAEVMQRLERFLGVQLTSEQRDKIIAHCSFNSMKDNKMTNREKEPALHAKGLTFMRKGIVGDWKNYFTVAQNEAFDELFKKEIEGSGLSFKFE